MIRAREEVEEYIREIAPRLQALSRGLTRDHHEAEDLLQDTLVKIYSNWRKVSKADNRDAYVRRIMVNLFLSRTQRAGFRKEHSTEDAALIADLRSPAPDSTSLVASHDYLLSLLSTLSPMQRAVLTLRFVEDLSDDAIGELLDVSRASAATAGSRGLAALRARLSRQDAENGVAPERPLRLVVGA